MRNFIKLSMSVMFHCLQTFSLDFLESLLKRQHLKDLNNCKQICKVKENQYNNDKEIIDSTNDFFTNILKTFLLKNIPENFLQEAAIVFNRYFKDCWFNVIWCERYVYSYTNF